MRRYKALQRGRKSRKWDRVRANLKQIFERSGIVSCEICGGTFALSFAHRLKRRFITDDAELNAVALLCQQHHSELEVLPHQDMYDQITAIIKNRFT